MTLQYSVVWRLHRLQAWINLSANFWRVPIDFIKPRLVKSYGWPPINTCQILARILCKESRGGFNNTDWQSWLEAVTEVLIVACNELDSSLLLHFLFSFSVKQNGQRNWKKEFFEKWYFNERHKQVIMIYANAFYFYWHFLPWSCNFIMKKWKIKADNVDFR